MAADMVKCKHDIETEYQINDRISFMRFLGLGLGNTVPDANYGRWMARS